MPLQEAESDAEDEAEEDGQLSEPMASKSSKIARNNHYLHPASLSNDNALHGHVAMRFIVGHATSHWGSTIWGKGVFGKSNKVLHKVYKSLCNVLRPCCKA